MPPAKPKANSHVPRRSGQVFISYKREEAPIAGRLRAALEEAGFSTWWDEDIQTGQQWAQALDDAVKDAAAIVVLWSPRSVESRWVAHEASVAVAEDKYAPVRIELVAIPPPYDRIQATDLMDWEAGLEHPGYRSLVARLDELMPAPTPVVVRILRRLRPLVLPVLLVMIALFLVSRAFKELSGIRQTTDQAELLRLQGIVFRTPCGEALSTAGAAAAEISRREGWSRSMDRACLAGADLASIDLRDAYLERADLRSAQMERSKLSNAYLHSANLEGANLEWSDLANASLGKASLAGANLVQANLAGANLWGTNLDGAALGGVNLTLAQRSPDDPAIPGWGLIRCDATGGWCLVSAKWLEEEVVLDEHREACDQGDLDRCNELALLHQNRVHGKNDPASALRVYLDACERGSARACTNAGVMFSTNAGLETNLASARAYYEDGCEKGNVIACGYLGEHEYYGAGGQRDEARGLNRLRNACDHGGEWSCRWLMYRGYRDYVDDAG